MKYRKIVSALMAAVLSVTGISGGTMLSASAETGAVRTDIVSDSEQLASSDNTFGSMLAADINEQQAQIQSGCVIYKAEMFGTAANVRFDTVQDGRIIVGLYEDPGDEEKQAPKLLGTGICDVTAEQKEVFVNIEGLDSVPDYYLIRAYLVSYSGALLSQEYENPMHTQAMEDLLKSNITQYADHETLNLDGDDNTNFIVYSHNTTVLRTNGTENLVTEQDPDAGVYKISNYTGPTKTGDLVAIEGGGNRVAIFKIGSVEKNGSVTTIFSDTSMDPSEALEFIKIETDSSQSTCTYIPPDQSELPEGITVSGEVVTDQAEQKRPVIIRTNESSTAKEYNSEDYTVTSDYLKFRFQLGKSSSGGVIDVNGGTEITFSDEFGYYKSHLLKHIDLSFNLDVEHNIQISGGLEGKIPIGAGIVTSTSSGFAFHLGPYLYGSIKGMITLGGSLHISYSSQAGLDHDYQPDVSDLSVEGRAGIGVGVGFSSKLLFDINAHLDFTAGVKAELHSDEPHEGCSSCKSGIIYLEFCASGGFDVVFLNLNIELSFGMELWHFYISKPLGFGWGECPNKNKTSGEDPGDDDEDDGLTAAERELFKFYKKTINGVEGYGISLKEGTDRSALKSLGMPSYYEGKPVIYIGSYAFSQCDNIESISFPDNIMFIGSWAFTDLSRSLACEPLAQLKIPDNNVQIAASAFCGARIYELILPNSEEAISKINANAFYQATVNTVTIPNGVTVFNNTCLNKLYGFETVNFPATLTEIGDYAFFDCPLLNIEIPSSVKKIGQFAFALDSVHNKYAAHPEPTVFSTLTIPASVERIESGAFRRVNNINTIIIENGSKLQTKYSANCPFAGMANVTSLTLPQSWTEIPMDIACGLNSLKSVSIGTNVITVGTDAFRNTAISEINLPDTVQYINPGAFQGCKNLKQITIPSSVVKIGSVAFRGCESITEIVLPKSVKEISFDSMRSMASLNSVTFLNPNTVIDASWSTMNGTEWDDVYDCPVWNRDQLTIYGYTGSTAETFAKENNFKFSALSGKPETPITTTPGTTPQQPEEPKDEPLSITFTGLKPNTLYNFYDLLGTQFTAENLLYISQGVSDESGTLTVWYRPKADDTEAQKFVKCADPPPLYGDTNLDGFIDVADAVRLARYIAEDVTVEITDAGRRNGDCNHDGDISGDDCIMILMFIAKIITEI